MLTPSSGTKSLAPALDFLKIFYLLEFSPNHNITLDKFKIMWYIRSRIGKTERK